MDAPSALNDSAMVEEVSSDDELNDVQDDVPIEDVQLDEPIAYAQMDVLMVLIDY